MRSTVVVVLMIAMLRSPAGADPGSPAPAPYDPDAAARASEPGTRGSAEGSPWIDLAPSKVLAGHAPEGEARGHKRAAALTLAGLYVGFAAWTYFAWYNKGCRPAPRECHQFVWGRDGSFGAETYAGGADKLGHAWATMGLARLGTELLDQWGGYGRRKAAVIGTLLSEALFLGVELRDGFTYQMSYWDATFNTLGAALAFAQSMSPRLDELFDFRVQYFPSTRFREKLRGGDVDVAEDYSGQTYLLAFHLGGIRPLRDSRWGGWSRYVDVALGFETRGYKPDPPYAIDPEDPAKQDYPHRQTMFVGLTLNMQGVVDRALAGKSRPRKALHGVFEVFNLPYTTLPLLDKTRRPKGPTAEDGA